MDDYLDELDALLLAMDSDDAMLLSDLDGFLAGIAVSPDLVPPSGWLTRIWGAGPPPFEDAEQLGRFIELVMWHYNDLLLRLDDPNGYEPLIEIDTRTDETLWQLWVDGFAGAMKLAPHGWNRLRASDDESAKAALAGMAELIAIAPRFDLTEEELKRWDSEAPGLIAARIAVLHPMAPRQ